MQGCWLTRVDHSIRTTAGRGFGPAAAPDGGGAGGGAGAAGHGGGGRREDPGLQLPASEVSGIGEGGDVGVPLFEDDRHAPLCFLILNIFLHSPTCTYTRTCRGDGVVLLEEGRLPSKVCGLCSSVVCARVYICITTHYTHSLIYTRGRCTCASTCGARPGTRRRRRSGSPMKRTHGGLWMGLKGPLVVAVARRRRRAGAKGGTRRRGPERGWTSSRRRRGGAAR